MFWSFEVYLILPPKEGTILTKNECLVLSSRPALVINLFRSSHTWLSLKEEHQQRWSRLGMQMMPAGWSPTRGPPQGLHLESWHHLFSPSWGQCSFTWMGRHYEQGSRKMSRTKISKQKEKKTAPKEGFSCWELVQLSQKILEASAINLQFTYCSQHRQFFSIYRWLI